MEELKQTIEAKEFIKEWFDFNLVRREKWFNDCKAQVKTLKKEISLHKKELAKMSKVK